ncbi:hypothetical protein [Streptomyces abyssomicinicus]|nr:hypothetical protein [Streptomyces abyssomicinicus]
MYLYTLTMTGPELDPGETAGIVHRIRARAEDVAGVEHLRVHSGPGEIALAVFLLADDAPHARRTVRELCRRVLDGTGAPARWFLSSPPVAHDGGLTPW